MQLFPALPEVVQGIFRPAPFGRLERRGGGPCERGIFIVDHTTNYQLSQWETTDRILMTDFNSDNAKIDAALKANAEAIAAETTARAGLAQTVAGKADQSALEAEAAARGAADTALETRFAPQLLDSGTLTAELNLLEVDLQDMDWSHWASLHLVVDPASGSAGYQGMLNFNASYEFLESGSGALHLILWPMGDGTLGVRGLCCCYNGSPFAMSLTFQEVEEISLQGRSGNFQAGTRWRLYGQAM